jgi:chorismate mutase
MEIVVAIIGAVAVLLAALITARRSPPSKARATKKLQADGTREVLNAITKISLILDKNYAEKILDDLTHWESEVLTKAEILSRVLVRIEETVQLLKGLQTSMDDDKYRSDEFFKAASAEIGAASVFSAGRYEEILENAQRSKQRHRSDAETLAAVYRTLMRMASYEPQSANSVDTLGT